MAYKASQAYDMAGAAAAGNTVTVTVPSQVAVGDRLIMLFATDDNNPVQVPTPPATEVWSLHGGDPLISMDNVASTSNPCVWLYSKEVSADDFANKGVKTYSFSVSETTEEQAGWLSVYDPCTVNVIGAGTDVAGTTNTCPSINTTDSDEIILYVMVKDSGVVFTTVPNTLRLNDFWGATSGAGSAMAVSEKNQPTAGATGTASFDLATENSMGFTFSLKPAITGPQANIAITDGNDTMSVTADVQLIYVDHSFRSLSQAPLADGTAVQAVDATSLSGSNPVILGEGTIAGGLGAVHIVLYDMRPVILIPDPTAFPTNEFGHSPILTPTVV